MTTTEKALRERVGELEADLLEAMKERDAARDTLATLAYELARAGVVKPAPDPA